MIITILLFLLSVCTAEAVRMNAGMHDGSYLIKLAEHSYLFSYRDFSSGGKLGSANYYSRLYSVNDLNVPLDDTIANSFFSFSRSTLYPIIAKPFTLHGNLVLPMIVKDVSPFDPDDADSTSATLQLASVEKIKNVMTHLSQGKEKRRGSELDFAEPGYVFKSHNSPVYILEVLELGNVHYALTASTFGNMLITPLEKENSGVKSFLQKHVRTFSSIKNLKNMFLLDVQKNENNGYLILYAKIMKKKKLSLIDPVFSLDVQCYLKEVKSKEDLFNLANNPGTFVYDVNNLMSDQENVPLVGFLCKDAQAVVFYQKVDSVQKNSMERTVKLFQNNNPGYQEIQLCSEDFIGAMFYPGMSLNDRALCKEHLGCLMRMKGDGYGLCKFKKLYKKPKPLDLMEEEILLKVNFETGQIERFLIDLKKDVATSFYQYFDSSAADIYHKNSTYELTNDFKKLQIG